MSICPNCHTMDKNFFAPKCHACNTPVGFFEQCFISLTYNVTLVLTLVGMWYLFKWMFF